MMITKKQIKLIVIILYILLSLGYIIYVQWSNFRIQYIEQSFTQGRQVTIREIIGQAEKEGCQPFTVYTEEKQIQLVNVACLQKAAGQNQEMPAEE